MNVTSILIIFTEMFQEGLIQSVWIKTVLMARIIKNCDRKIGLSTHRTDAVTFSYFTEINVQRS